jgi:2-polyprenyl-6-methoxyphenol hydroxylase-like FAD-dependent oxidoreductase
VTLPDPPNDGRGALLLPIEDHRWIVTATARHGARPPGDPEGFLQYFRQLRTSTIYDAIRAAAPIGPIERFVFPASVRRHFEHLDLFPRGLLPIADAICHFNPVYGQGMSVAAIEACRLKSLLDALSADDDPLAALAPRYFAAIAPIIDTPWAVATLDFAFPGTLGTRPEGFDRTLQFTRALNRLSAREPEVHRLMMEVQQLLRPREVYREPQFLQRIAAEMESAHRSSR